MGPTPSGGRGPDGAAGRDAAQYGGCSLWFVFGAGVWLRLRRASGPDSLASACFAFGFVGFVVLLLAGFTAFFVLAYRDADVGDPRLLYDLTFGLLAMSGAPTAIALGSYAAAVFRSTVLPRWTAWFGVVGAWPTLRFSPPSWFPEASSLSKVRSSPLSPRRCSRGSSVRATRCWPPSIEKLLDPDASSRVKGGISTRLPSLLPWTTGGRLGLAIETLASVRKGTLVWPWWSPPSRPR
jgi:hypothetical protein